MTVNATNKFCTACGNALLNTAVVCPNCGTPTNLYRPSFEPPRKSKSTAVLLAVFLGIWSWLYTYEKNKKKFWLALGIFAVLFALVIIRTVYFAYLSGSGYELGTTEIIFSVVVNASWLLSPIGLGIWAIIDNSTKSAYWYEKYDTRKAL